MKSREHNSSRTSGNSSTDIEAAEWLVRLLDNEVDAEEPIADPMQRQIAFFDWLNLSPAHVRAFLEIMEVERRTRHPDPQRLIKIQELLESTATNVIQLYDPPHRARGSHSPALETVKNIWSRRRKALMSAAAVVAALTVATALYVGSLVQNVYTTSIGEQRTCKLWDGSVIVLNTDTQVEVDFSKQVRAIRLLKGEALFIVEHDAARPFIVDAGSANVRAVGTEFNVRRREQSTEVAVVEGVVQVSTVAEEPLSINNSGPSRSVGGSSPDTGNNPAALRLAAGERAQVSNGGMKVSASHDLEDVLSWRQRRLTFRDARLADVAAEFNRYNRSQLRIEGSAAQEMQMTGIFDADHPQAIVLFAQKNDALTVEPQGDNWVIRSRD